MPDTLNSQDPQYIWARKVYAMLGKDPDIFQILFREIEKDQYEIKIYVLNVYKADCIERLLGKNIYREFGNVTVSISVVVANKRAETYMDAIIGALSGNPLFDHAMVVSSSLGEYKYIMFKDTVLQYSTNDIRRANGMESILAEDLAKEVFDLNGINCCTTIGDNGIFDWPC